MIGAHVDHVISVFLWYIISFSSFKFVRDKSKGLTFSVPGWQEEEKLNRPSGLFLTSSGLFQFTLICLHLPPSHFVCANI